MSSGALSPSLSFDGGHRLCCRSRASASTCNVTGSTHHSWWYTAPGLQHLPSTCCTHEPPNCAYCAAAAADGGVAACTTAGHAPASPAAAPCSTPNCTPEVSPEAAGGPARLHAARLAAALGNIADAQGAEQAADAFAYTAAAAAAGGSDPGAAEAGRLAAQEAAPAAAGAEGAAAFTGADLFVALDWSAQSSTAGPGMTKPPSKLLSVRCSRWWPKLSWSLLSHHQSATERQIQQLPLPPAVIHVWHWVLMPCSAGQVLVVCC